MYTQSLQASGLASWAGVEEDPPIPSSASLDKNSNSNTSSPVVVMETLPTKGPFWPAGSAYAAAAPLTANRQRSKALQAAARSMYLGVTSIPLPPAGDSDGATAALQQEVCILS